MAADLAGETWQPTYRWGTLLPAHSERAMERKERLRIKEAEERIGQVKRTTAIMVRSSYANLVSAHETILSRKKNIETAEEGLRIARESYKNGIIKNSELLGSELALTEGKDRVHKGALRLPCKPRGSGPADRRG